MRPRGLRLPKVHSHLVAHRCFSRCARRVYQKTIVFSSVWISLVLLVGLWFALDNVENPAAAGGGSDGSGGDGEDIFVRGPNTYEILVVVVFVVVEIMVR